MCKISRRRQRFHRISARYIHDKLGLHDIDTYIVRRHLRWLGHVARMPEDRLPRLFLTSWIRHRRANGCPHFTYARGVFKSLKKAGIDKNEWYELAQDRHTWRSLVNATH